MAKSNQKNAEALVDRLAHSLLGTHGRVISIESLRSLAAIEVEEWKFDLVKINILSEKFPLNQYNTPLISGVVRLNS